MSIFYEKIYIPVFSQHYQIRIQSCLQELTSYE